MRESNPLEPARSAVRAPQLPPLVAPVVRTPDGRASLAASGVEPAASACAGLTGLAGQMCYAAEYGVLN